VKRQGSTGGGTTPRWRRDGKELFYAASDGKLMAVDVHADAQSFKPGVPHALFDAQLDALAFLRALASCRPEAGREFRVWIPDKWISAPSRRKGGNTLKWPPRRARLL